MKDIHFLDDMINSGKVIDCKYAGSTLDPSQLYVTILEERGNNLVLSITLDEKNMVRTEYDYKENVLHMHYQAGSQLTLQNMEKCVPESIEKLIIYDEV